MAVVTLIAPRVPGFTMTIPAAVAVPVGMVSGKLTPLCAAERSVLTGVDAEACALVLSVSSRAVSALTLMEVNVPQ